jgi:hypothetical protein
LTVEDSEVKSEGSGLRPLSSKLGFPSSGFGSNPKLEVALTSYHIKHNANDKTNFNQFDAKNNKFWTNPGVGLSVDSGVSLFGSPVRIEAVVYNNSYFKTTAAVAAEWKPIEVNLPGGLKGSFGGIAGIATGYAGHVSSSLQMGPFVPVIAARATIENESTALNVSVIPGPPKTGATAFCISASIKF